MPTRTITYSRATWAPPASHTLQSALAGCVAALPDAAQTRLPLRTGHAEVRHRDTRPQDIRLHIAAWTDDEAMSTVPDVPTGSAADLGSLPAGQDWDYLDGDGMVLVSDDHYLSLASGLSQRSIEHYIRALLGTQGRQDIASFQLFPVADPAVVHRVQQEGVKKFNLNVAQYKETTHDSDGPTTIVENIGSNLSAILSLVDRDERRADILAAANVSAKLVISLDRRRPGATPEDLASVATPIASESEDSIEMETTSGHRIKHGQLILKKVVDVDAFAKTVHHQHSWELMEEYLRELRLSGMLDQ